MTHNDLLQAVQSEHFMNSRTLETPYIALLEVLKLHTPFPSGVCGCELDQPLSYKYPCLTVQAIEKELSF